MDTTLLKKKTKAGFTLVELLVVITIIGILTALIAVAAAGALKAMRRNQIKVEINEITTGVEESKNKVTSYPPNCQTDDTSVGGPEPANSPLSEADVLNNLRRYIKQLAPRSQESDDLAKALTGQIVGNGYRRLEGGITAGEAVVFWLGGFSSDPKFPISGDGGPSYSIVGVTAQDRRKADPIESRRWVYPFDVSRLGPRAADGYFDESTGRYIEYTDPKGVLRRINFWQYTPSRSDQPYLYFDTSRHPVGTVSGNTLLATYDPPAATAPTGLGPGGQGLNVFALKKVPEAAVPVTAPRIQFINPDKFQVLHCGIDGAWDEAAFKKIGVKTVGTNNPDDYLLFPTGPFVGDIADNEVSFTPETTLEDAAK
jgi:prepilin-type N-terminal cleavage/methylation domain-containing protein